VWVGAGIADMRDTAQRAYMVTFRGCLASK
jgi:hypothetical protein